MKVKVEKKYKITDLSEIVALEFVMNSENND